MSAVLDRQSPILQTSAQIQASESLKKENVLFIKY